MEPNTGKAEETTLRDHIGAAVQNLTKEPEPKVTEPKVTEPKVTEPKVTEPKVTEPKVTEPKVTEPKVTEPKPVSTKDSPPVTSEKITSNARGPASWKPEIREKWNALPSEVQTEVLRREHETSRALQESAEARRFHAQFQQVADPFKHYMALENKSPLDAFGDYLKTAAVLRGGTPVEKATAVAQAITMYGVDVGMLDQALSQALAAGGQMPQQNFAMPQQQQQFKDPRLDTLLSQMEEYQSKDQKTKDEELAKEILEFSLNPENEFFEDVRADVGDILLLASNRGQKMSLKEAYDKAIQLNPSISKIIQQRKDALTAEELERKRKAAGGVYNAGVKQTGIPADSSATIREAIEASIQQHSS